MDTHKQEYLNLDLDVETVPDIEVNNSNSDFHQTDITGLYLHLFLVFDLHNFHIYKTIEV